ncbi:hypothetical protein B0H14DRAFT_2821242, partial [Mycena olivaceomarginata]
MFCIVPSYSFLHTFPPSKACVTFIPFLPSPFVPTLSALLPSHPSLLPLSVIPPHPPPHRLSFLASLARPCSSSVAPPSLSFYFLHNPPLAPLLLPRSSRCLHFLYSRPSLPSIAPSTMTSTPTSSPLRRARPRSPSFSTPRTIVYYPRARRTRHSATCPREDGLRIGRVNGARTRDSTTNTAHRTVAALVACGLRESRTGGPGQTCRVVPRARSVRVDVVRRNLAVQARARGRTWYGPGQGQGRQHLLCSGSKYCDWKGARGRSSTKSSPALLAAHSPGACGAFSINTSGAGVDCGVGRGRKDTERACTCVC